jgi:lysophospholipase L1-like esterase
VNRVGIVLCLALIGVLSACDEPAGRPRVLLLGDSISIGYADAVKSQLGTRAEVHRIADNAETTANAVENVGRWLGDESWDVIYFNCGLHDIKIMPDGTRQVSEKAYEANLRQLVRELKESGAKLIWASTTPVPAGAGPVGQRVAADVPVYNAIASRVMVEENIVIDDLYAFAKPQLSIIQRPGNVHFTDAGSIVLGKRVASTIAAYLPSGAVIGSR